MMLRLFSIVVLITFLTVPSLARPNSEQANSAETLLEDAKSSSSASAVQKQNEELKDEVKEKVEHMKHEADAPKVDAVKRSPETPPIKDEVNATPDKETVVPLDSKPFKLQNRRRRQFGWSTSAVAFPFYSGSFYNYNPYTLSTVTGWYNNFGSATAFSGFNGFGTPMLMNTAMLYGR